VHGTEKQIDETGGPLPCAGMTRIRFEGCFLSNCASTPAQPHPQRITADHKPATPEKQRQEHPVRSNMRLPIPTAIPDAQPRPRAGTNARSRPHDGAHVEVHPDVGRRRVQHRQQRQRSRLHHHRIFDAKMMLTGGGSGYRCRRQDVFQSLYPDFILAARRRSFLTRRSWRPGVRRRGASPCGPCCPCRAWSA
jgi:hypothetical protein